MSEDSDVAAATGTLDARPANAAGLRLGRIHGEQGTNKLTNYADEDCKETCKHKDKDQYQCIAVLTVFTYQMLYLCIHSCLFLEFVYICAHYCAPARMPDVFRQQTFSAAVATAEPDHFRKHRESQSRDFNSGRPALSVFSGLS